MILRIAADLALTLEQSSDFKRFKIEVNRREADLVEVANRNQDVLRFQDEKTAWVNATAFSAFGGLSDDPEWRESFSAMLDHCKKMGWLSDDGREFRSHVEWAS